MPGISPVLLLSPVSRRVVRAFISSYNRVQYFIVHSSMYFSALNGLTVVALQSKHKMKLQFYV